MGKRELPTRHNFLTETVKNLLEPSNTNTEPLIDGKSVITVTSDEKALSKYEHHPSSNLDPSIVIEHVPQVRIIEPVARKKQRNDEEAEITDEYYLKRHRRHEMDEKKQKNREKERLRHGYYQQKQLVERIKTMDKSHLQSIVSSIRHRTHQNEEVIEEEYLNDLHHRLLKDALEHLRRYEVLGLCNQKEAAHMIEEEQVLLPQEDLIDLSPTPTESHRETQFHKSLQLEAKKQRQNQMKSFSGQLQSNTTGSRRSTRRVIAFGQKLPEFEPQEFDLPEHIILEGKHFQKK
ncbi:hypothetical protein EDC96DRAFT_509390 [Choanephora cucurbitarum]|nr:hypothetical protein EDC96DRAFT_509390 [Choanephora cucurbitarum]